MLSYLAFSTVFFVVIFVDCVFIKPEIATAVLIYTLIFDTHMKKKRSKSKAIHLVALNSAVDFTESVSISLS